MLEATQPYVIEPTEGKEFPGLWLSNISIHAPTVDSVSLRIELLPYKNTPAPEIGPAAGMEVLFAPDIFAAASSVTEVAVAYQAILAAINPLREWLQTQ